MEPPARGSEFRTPQFCSPDRMACAVRAASPLPSTVLLAGVPSVFTELKATYKPAHVGKFQTEFYLREVWTTCEITGVILLTNCNCLGEF